MRTEAEEKLRDETATSIMAAIISNPKANMRKIDNNLTAVAKEAYRVADAMLRARRGY